MERIVNYLRISITDQCNLRCSYCMPSTGLSCCASSDLLSFEEIERLAGIFVQLGIEKIRLTGGEPLLRKNLTELIQRLKAIKGLKRLALTTNGIFLAEHAASLKTAGIDEINVSLDTLNPDKFYELTGRYGLSNVLEGIQCAQDLNFSSVKINTVILSSFNENEICDFVDYALRHNLTLRFIEFMPITPLWQEKYCYPVNEIRQTCQEKFSLIPSTRRSSGPAEYFTVNDKIQLGFISTDFKNCSECNRLRLTPQGYLKTCLYEPQGTSLKMLLHDGVTDEDLKQIIMRKMNGKSDVNFNCFDSKHIYMSQVGG